MHTLALGLLYLLLPGHIVHPMIFKFHSRVTLMRSSLPPYFKLQTLPFQRSHPFHHLTEFILLILYVCLFSGNASSKRAEI